MLPQVQPAVPLPNGRPGHNVSYASSPHPPQQSPYYAPYQYQYPIQYQQRPPQQWTPYPLPMPMGRGYQPYLPMAHYPLPQHLHPMRPALQHVLPSSPIHSAQTIYSPTSSSASLHVPSSASMSTSNPHLAPPTPPPPSVPPPSHRTPFYPPLPWQSFEGAFPARALRRRRRTPAPQSSSVPVELPSRRGSAADEESVAETATPNADAPPQAEETLHQPLSLDTPSTSHPPSEALSTQPTTPSSAAPPHQSALKINPSGRPNGHIVPIVPAIPNIPIVSRPSKRASVSVASEAVNGAAPSNTDHLANAVKTAAAATQEETENNAKSPSPPVKASPKSWADLVRTMGQSAASGTSQATQAINGAFPQVNGFAPAKSKSLVDALSSYSVKEINETAKIAFLEPRGLVNTGNMCYMNSVSRRHPLNARRKLANGFAGPPDTSILRSVLQFSRNYWKASGSQLQKRYSTHGRHVSGVARTKVHNALILMSVGSCLCANSLSSMPQFQSTSFECVLRIMSWSSMAMPLFQSSYMRLFGDYPDSHP